MGKVKNFLLGCIDEVNKFEKNQIIDSKKIKWTSLYKMMRNKK